MTLLEERIMKQASVHPKFDFSKVFNIYIKRHVNSANN